MLMALVLGRQRLGYNNDLILAHEILVLDHILTMLKHHTHGMAMASCQ